MGRAAAILLAGKPAAASPIVAATATSVNETNSAGTVTLPASSAGDLLIVAVNIEGNASSSTPSGWTALGSKVDGGSGDRPKLQVFYKVAGGSEGTSLAITGAAWGAYLAWRITGYQGTPEIQTYNHGGANGTGNTADPPSITPTWGSAPNLYIAIAATLDATVTAAPSGYTGLIATETTSHGSIDAAIGGAYLRATSSSEDPGTMSLGATNIRVAATIAVRPA